MLQPRSLSKNAHNDEIIESPIRWVLHESYRVRKVLGLFDGSSER